MPSIKLEVQPFTIPNFVIGKMPNRLRQEGIGEGVKWHLTEVDADVLAELCDTFRAAVFELAEKADPATLDKSYHR